VVGAAVFVPVAVVVAVVVVVGCCVVAAAVVVVASVVVVVVVVVVSHCPVIRFQDPFVTINTKAKKKNFLK
jgi:hypothetical protein